MVVYNDAGVRESIAVVSTTNRTVSDTRRHLLTRERETDRK